MLLLLAVNLFEWLIALDCDDDDCDYESGDEIFQFSLVGFRLAVDSSTSSSWSSLVDECALNGLCTE